jgi:hypothetical protein
MPNITVFLLNIIDNNSLHGLVRELRQDNGYIKPNRLRVGRELC